MPLLPKEPADLALAPVAAHVDQNLARLRDMSVAQIEADLALQRNDEPHHSDPSARAARVLFAALRFTDMHGWQAEITSDYARVRLSGGSVSVELGLSPTIRSYIMG